MRSLSHNTKAAIVHSGSIAASGTGAAIDLQGFSSLMALVHIQSLPHASANYSLTFSWKEGDLSNGSDAVAITDPDRIFGDLVVNAAAQSGSVHKLGVLTSAKRYYFLCWTESAGTATAASVTGTIDGPFAILNGANDALSIKVDGAGATAIDLGAGAARTIAQVVSDINTALGAVIASALGNKLVLTSTTTGAGSSIELAAVSADAYATLGLTEGASYVGYESFSGTFSILGVLGHPVHGPVA